MRITVNTLSVSDDNEGIRTLLIGLVHALARIDSVNVYRLIVSRANLELFDDLRGQMNLTVLQQRRRQPLLRILHDQVTVPYLVRHNTDILVSPATVGSVLAPTPQVVIVVAHLALSSIRRDAGDVRLSRVHQAYYGPIMRFSHRRADAVVAISDFLGRRLVTDTHLQPEKVHAIPCGIDPLPRAAAPAPQAAGGIPYVLFVSTLYPYKNADALVRSLALANARLPAPVRAVIAGRDPDGKQHRSLRTLSAELGVADAVELKGKVSQEELDRLYAGALGVVFPSRAEGFGFSALEAMARGIPVVASDRTSLPEVVGGAGLLVDPDRPETMADALIQLVSDEALRRRLTDAGMARADELTWDRAARSYVDLFAEVGARRATTRRR